MEESLGCDGRCHNSMENVETVARHSVQHRIDHALLDSMGIKVEYGTVSCRSHVVLDITVHKFCTITLMIPIYTRHKMPKNTLSFESQTSQSKKPLLA
jgi:hypothetical protein